MSRIVEAEAYTASLEFAEPFTIALGTIAKVENVFVKLITSDGLVGWGEAAPTKKITFDDVEAVYSTLELLMPKVLGMNPLEVEKLRQLIVDVGGSSSAKAAVDMAFHDLYAQCCGKPLYRMLGGFRSEIETDITIGIKGAEYAVRDALKAVEMGFKALKVKVGFDPEEDVKRVKSIRDAVGWDVKLRLDANQGWSYQQALKALKAMENLEVELVEQPLPAEDLEGHAKLRSEVGIPIMLDESVHTPADALKAVQLKAADFINVKLMKSSGIRGALEIFAVAEAAGVKCMVGCMAESSLAVTAGVHVALASRAVALADLDADLLLKASVFQTGTAVKNGVRVVEEIPGLGVKAVDREVLGTPLRTWRL